MNFHQNKETVTLMKNTPNDHADQLNEEGIQWLRKRQIEKALNCFEKAVQVDPQHAHALCNIGRIYYEKSQWEKAVQYFEKSISIYPKLPEAYSNFGLTLHRLNQMDRAIELYLKALEINPAYPIALLNMGFTLEKMGRLDESIRWYEKAIAMKPDYIDAHSNLAMTLLLNGNYKQGFLEYEWRFKKEDAEPRTFQSIPWDGRSFINKKLLVYPEQGYGDSIQFMRYLPKVKNKGGVVILETHKYLAPLLSGLPYIDKIVIHGEPSPQVDYHIAIASLPHVFETTLETIPCRMPYLFRPENEKSILVQTIEMMDGFRIGISWSGSPVHKENQNRSCPLSLFYPLTQIKGVVLFGIQKGPACNDIKQCKQIPVVDLSDLIHDFSDTATAIFHMDLIISVDTATAHLAGAMGKPTWIMIPFTPDWRWMRDRTDSPWYPSIRLFRQSEAFNFNDVMQKIEKTLIDVIKNPHSFNFISTANKTAIDLFDQKRLDDSIHIYKRLLCIAPDIDFLHSNLGMVYLNKNQLDKALQEFETANRLSPESATIYRMLGIANRRLGRYDQAMTYFQKALEINPSDASVLYNEIGTLNEKRAELDEAIQFYNKAIAITPNKPEIYRNLAHAYLLKGQLKEGFKLYEWRFKCADYKSRVFNEIPMWKGERFDGKTLFLCTEQGFGDIIQFIRYAPMVKALGGTVAFGTFPNMIRLISKVIGIDRVFDKEPICNFAYQIPLLSLPAIFETDMDTIPKNIPYIYPPEIVGDWISIVRDNPAKLKIGLSWAGSQKHPEDYLRSMPLETLKPLLNLSHTNEIAFFSLQIGERSLTESDTHWPIIDLNPHINDFADSAAAIDQMDLVISVDTSTAHLAGAMGKPVWLMIPVSPDWRWMFDRKDSPWYPTMSIFRQKNIGDWALVVNNIVQSLCIEAAKNGDLFFNKDLLDQAEFWYQLSIKIDPRYATAYTNMGVICEKRNQIDSAIHWYRQSLDINPDSASTHKNLGHALLLKGNLTEGFKEYQWRLKCQKFLNDPKHDIDVWKGEPLENKTILLYSEQGFGDIIQFVRYAPFLKERGATTVVGTFPNLTRLLEKADGVDRAVSNAQEKEFDYQVHLLSLPHLTGTHKNNIPSKVPYFNIAKEDVENFLTIIDESDNHVNVGLVWEGDPNHPNNKNRSISLDILSPLFKISGLRLYCFQKNTTKNDFITDLSDHIQDFYDTAAAMMCMDAVISVDTAPGHLAGALGKPVYLLLPFTPDWRWMLDSASTPWYPDMKLLRQNESRTWEPVIEQLLKAIAAIFCDKGDKLVKAQKHTSAIDMYQKSLAQDASYVKSLNNMGVALQYLKKYDKAKSCFQKALQINPNHAEARNNLALSENTMETLQKQSMREKWKTSDINPKPEQDNTHKKDLKYLVHGIGYFHGHTGYNIHTSNFFAQLKKFVPFVQTDLQRPELTRVETDKALNTCNDPILNIAITYGNKLNVLAPCPGIRIGYTVWESTKLPDDWLEPMQIPDQLWTPSSFCKQVMVNHGFKSEKIRVVPEGIDPTIFHPNATPLPGSEKIKGFKFLNVGKYEERKCTPYMIRAFDEEFKNTKDVVLILSCHNPFEKGFDIREKLGSLQLKCPEKILLINPVKEHQSVAQLYASCDAFLFPSRAEGWGLPIIEALACGLPTIVTNYSGQTEYLTKEMAYLLDYEFEDINIPFFASKDGYYGQWARPDMNQFRYYLRYIYENQEEARQKGLNAAKNVHENWTWEHAAKIAVHEIEHLLKQAC